MQVDVGLEKGGLIMVLKTFFLCFYGVVGTAVAQKNSTLRNLQL